MLDWSLLWSKWESLNDWLTSNWPWSGATFLIQWHGPNLYMPINKGLTTNYTIKEITKVFLSDLDTQPIMGGMEAVEGLRQPSVSLLVLISSTTRTRRWKEIASTTPCPLHQAGMSHCWPYGYVIDGMNPISFMSWCSCYKARLIQRI
jgi:hypothetical protein